MPNDAKVAVLQAALTNLGIDVGEIDGIRGPRLEAGLREYLGEIEGVKLDENTMALIRELERDEGFRSYVYQDSEGYWTIGIGRMVDKRLGGGITKAEADYLKLNDIAKFRMLLDQKIPWWRELDPVRQRAVQNMAFQMGVGDFDGPTFDLIRDGRYREAATRLRGWTWAAQTPARAKRVIDMIEKGVAS